MRFCTNNKHLIRLPLDFPPHEKETESTADGLTTTTTTTTPNLPAAPSPRTSGESHHSKKRRSENAGESEEVKVKKDSKDHRKNGGGGGQKKKSSERREARQDEREAMTTGNDPAPHGTSSGGTKAEDGKPSRHNDDEDDAGSADALHPPTPWPGRLHGQNSSGAVRTTAATATSTNAAGSNKQSGDAAGGEPADKPNRRKEKRHEKEAAAASPEVKPHAEPAHASPPSDKRRKEEKRKEERRTDYLKVEACEQQRRASSELLRGHKEKGRAFWNKERTPRRGILVRSLSAEQLPTTSHKSSQGCLDGDAVPSKRKRSKKHKRKALQDEGVKFDKVVVRHYPREVAIGGCMLDPDQGPFLGRPLLPPRLRSFVRSRLRFACGQV